MYFHSGSLQPIDNWSRQKQMGLHHAERGGKNSNRIFLSTRGVSDEFFCIFKFYDTTIKFKSTSFHCSDTGCMYYKEDYKTIFQDDSNEDFIILSHIVQKLWWINHFWAKFKRPAKKYYRRRHTKAGFKRPRWRVKFPPFNILFTLVFKSDACQINSKQAFTNIRKCPLSMQLSIT
jgi:hypothetical protein